MKELSIQEKSERYDKAIERAEGLIDFCSDSELKTLEYVFPELKESEDERIRKEILDYIDKATGCKRWVAWIEKQGESVEINPSEFDSRLNKLLKQFETLPKEELISSLSFYLNVVQNNETYKEEKQREKPEGKSALEAIKEEKVDNSNKVEPTDYNSIDPHFGKPVDRIEPKFKVGDWCIDNEDGTIFQIVKVLDKTYKYRTNEGKEYSCTHYSLELDARLWNISDTKEGDMLVDSLGNVCIYQELSTKLMYHSHCYGNHKYFIYMGGSHEIVGSYPATKEQRDKLEKAMDDAGYAFDFEKKELKKIEDEDNQDTSN